MTIKELTERYGSVAKASYELKVTASAIYSWIAVGRIPERFWGRIIDSGKATVGELWEINEKHRRNKNGNN